MVSPVPGAYPETPGDEAVAVQEKEQPDTLHERIISVVSPEQISRLGGVMVVVTVGITDTMASIVSPEHPERATGMMW